MSLEDIKMSCPTDMIPYVKAHRVEIEEKDMHIWEWVGSYGIQSIVFSIDHVLRGRKAKTEYPDKPIVDGEMRRQIEQNNLQRQREQFVANLEAMKTAFEANHPKKKKEDKV